MSSDGRRESGKEEGYVVAEEERTGGGKVDSGKST